MQSLGLSSPQAARQNPQRGDARLRRQAQLEAGGWRTQGGHARGKNSPTSASRSRLSWHNFHCRSIRGRLRCPRLVRRTPEGIVDHACPVQRGVLQQRAIERDVVRNAVEDHRVAPELLQMHGAGLDNSGRMPAGFRELIRSTNALGSYSRPKTAPRSSSSARPPCIAWRTPAHHHGLTRQQCTSCCSRVVPAHAASAGLSSRCAQSVVTAVTAIAAAVPHN